eukprot:comp22275_c1_seq1/m.53125 comp22275_c1_seq1/g.53125  ORF comp22275_c1_seq1/g.53125 comp22275_c1_seq1/m.53125 type:complete len:342 (+) comp22275_c1_seq1:167-1192(+)
MLCEDIADENRTRHDCAEAWHGIMILHTIPCAKMCTDLERRLQCKLERSSSGSIRIGSVHEILRKDGLLHLLQLLRGQLRRWMVLLELLLELLLMVMLLLLVLVLLLMEQMRGLMLHVLRMLLRMLRLMMRMLVLVLHVIRRLCWSCQDFGLTEHWRCVFLGSILVKIARACTCTLGLSLSDACGFGFPALALALLAFLFALSTLGCSLGLLLFAFFFLFLLFLLFPRFCLFAFLALALGLALFQLAQLGSGAVLLLLLALLLGLASLKHLLAHRICGHRPRDLACLAVPCVRCIRLRRTLAKPRGLVSSGIICVLMLVLMLMLMGVLLTRMGIHLLMMGG